MIENLEKYAEEGRKRIALAKAAQEEKELREKELREATNRKNWLLYIEHAMSLLPEDLRDLVSVDATVDPYNATVYDSYCTLTYVPHVPIRIYIQSGGSEVYFRAVKNVTVQHFDGEPWIDISFLTPYNDPLMAIAEAADIAEYNAKIAAEFDAAFLTYKTDYDA